ncbi:unnamed protein product [Symbiodinium sp. CCMP2592]|nr:unnamed protein product [Symbiodinium sp. CCMP2592]
MSKEVLWEVVGGAASGGIVVRSGASLTTQQADLRLANGAIVRQLEKLARNSGRLRYELVRGTGPSSGWVSLRLQGKDLLTRYSAVQENSKDAGTEQVAAPLQKEAVARAPAYSISPTQPVPWVPQGACSTSYKGQCPTAQEAAWDAMYGVNLSQQPVWKFEGCRGVPIPRSVLPTIAPVPAGKMLINIDFVSCTS